MPRGLKIPIQPNVAGGLATVTGDENDAKIIQLALGPGANENAFQQRVTLGDDMMFGISDELLRSQVIGRLIEIFDDFERQKRFRLLNDTISWDEDSERQELILRFKYLNIESDELREFEQRYSAAR